MLNNYQRRQACTAVHTSSTGGVWQRGTNESPGVIICNDGHRQYKLRCRDCDTAGGPVSTKLLTAWGFTPGDLSWTQQNTPQTYEPCVYLKCETTPTEYHHFAPRNTFGDEADAWPCLPLCRVHHLAWHQRMDGYRWHRKGIAA